MVLSAVYSEPLLLLASVGAIYAARQGRWAVAGLLGRRGSGDTKRRDPAARAAADHLPPRTRGATGDRWTRPRGRFGIRYRPRSDLLWLLAIPAGLGLFMAVPRQDDRRSHRAVCGPGQVASQPRSAGRNRRRPLERPSLGLRPARPGRRTLGQLDRKRCSTGMDRSSARCCSAASCWPGSGCFASRGADCPPPTRLMRSAGSRWRFRFRPGARLSCPCRASNLFSSHFGSRSPFGYMSAIVASARAGGLRGAHGHHQRALRRLDHGSVAGLGLRA